MPLDVDSRTLLCQPRLVFWSSMAIQLGVLAAIDTGLLDGKQDEQLLVLGTLWSSHIRSHRQALRRCLESVFLKHMSPTAHQRTTRCFTHSCSSLLALFTVTTGWIIFD